MGMQWTFITRRDFVKALFLQPSHLSMNLADLHTGYKASACWENKSVPVLPDLSEPFFAFVFLPSPSTTNQGYVSVSVLPAVTLVTEVTEGKKNLLIVTPQQWGGPRQHHILLSLKQETISAVQWHLTKAIQCCQHCIFYCILQTLIRAPIVAVEMPWSRCLITWKYNLNAVCWWHIICERAPD